jgi:hypothetical protein
MIDEVRMNQNRQSAEQLYQTLMQMHEQAFAVERFELSYHLLAAALHAAVEVENQDWLADVEILATDRQTEIDQHHTREKSSSTSASGRGTIARFTSLAATAAAMRGRIVAQQALQRTHELDTELGMGGL